MLTSYNRKRADMSRGNAHFGKGPRVRECPNVPRGQAMAPPQDAWNNESREKHGSHGPSANVAVAGQRAPAASRTAGTMLATQAQAWIQRRGDTVYGAASTPQRASKLGQHGGPGAVQCRQHARALCPGTRLPARRRPLQQSKAPLTGRESTRSIYDRKDSQLRRNCRGQTRTCQKAFLLF